MKISKPVATVLIVIFIVGGTLAAKAILGRGAPVKSGDLARTKGSANARIKIIEFTDFQCPACSRASAALEEILKQYEGQVSLEHKHFPLKMHFHAFRASVFAECAAKQGKFWPFHDVIFKAQTSWIHMQDPDGYFLQLAGSLGLDQEKLKTCVAGPEAVQHIEENRKEGKALGVVATPSFVVNGKLVTGLPNLRTELGKLLTKGTHPF